MGAGILGSKVQADLCVSSASEGPDAIYCKAAEAVESRGVKRGREEKSKEEVDVAGEEEDVAVRSGGHAWSRGESARWSTGLLRGPAR